MLNEKNAQNIPRSLMIVKQNLNKVFSQCSDFVIREINIGGRNTPQVRVMIVFIEGLVDNNILNSSVIASIIKYDYSNSGFSLDMLRQRINTGKVKNETNIDKCIDSILTGDAVIFIDGSSTALVAKVRGSEGRSVAEPDTEVTMRGPREGFIEKGVVNVTLIRRKIKNPNFKVESFILGEQTNTSVFVCYIKGIADEKIVETVRRRIEKIDTDAILESGYIEQFIEDGPRSLFPTIGNSEKPDKVAAKMLEGRVAIVCDGTPFVITVPYLLIETIQAAEDYYEKFPFSSFVRLLRVAAVVISASLPSLYVAVISFHQGIIPFKLLLSVSASREGVPFSPFTEAFLMMLTFEFLREAGVRMPRTLGQTIGIIGAVIIGEAAVRAGIASNPMIIIVALTAVTSLISPPLLRPTTIMRFATLIAANILGLFGIAVTYTGVFIYLCTLRSFGVPYLSPMSPLNIVDMKDAYLKFPIWDLFTRPRVLVGDNKGNRYRMNIDKRKKED